MVRGPGGTKAELVDLELMHVGETDKAILVFNLKGDKVWLPKSQIEYETRSGTRMISVTLPEWLAATKELI